MDLTGAALRRSLPSALPAAARGRRRPSRVVCVGGLGFAEEGHLRYYEAGAAGARGVPNPKIRAVGLVAGDAAKEMVLSEFIQLKDDGYNMKKARKEEKAAMKALKKQQKDAEKAAAVMSFCEDGSSSSSESSESDCEDERIMETGKGVVTSMLASEVGASGGVSTVCAMEECDKAAMKAVKKMEREQKKAAKKAMKMMKKEAKKKMAVGICKDEDSSSSSSESSESECEGEVVRTSRCTTTIDTAPQQPALSTAFQVIVPQLPKSVPPELLPLQDPPRISSQSTPATPATLCTTSVAVVEKPPMASNRIEVCMGGKCKKSGSIALLQELEKEVGTAGAVVGCKCLGKCGLGPNVRLRSDGAADGSASVTKKNAVLCISVGLDDVGTIVTGLFGDGGGDLGITPA